MVYLDNAATTFPDDDILEIIHTSLHEDYINPSALYNLGHEQSNQIRKCKELIANNLGIKNQYKSIYFTSGGCEGNNWIVKGSVFEYYRYYRELNKNDRVVHTIKKPHIITTSFEHHSVLNACEQLEELGLAKVTYINPDPLTGIIDIEDIKKNISNYNDDYQTMLVSVMWVNNVLGTMQPIQEIGEICKSHHVKFHTDAVQAIGNVHIDLSEYNIDFMTVSGHKFHAPKGIGFVYIKDNKYLQPLISGGGQEFGFRAGTENLPYIKAITHCLCKYNEPLYISDKMLWVEKLKSRLYDYAMEEQNIRIFPSSFGIGTFNIAFKDLMSDVLVYNLGECGYMVSVGSACDNGSLEDSYVLSALKYSKDYIGGNIRVTFNENNTLQEIDDFIKVLNNEVYKMRGY